MSTIVGVVDPNFLGLARTNDPMRWQFPVTERLTGGKGFLFGGCYLAAAIESMETVTNRPSVWATAQYVSTAVAADVLDMRIDLSTEGRHLTQGRVVATCRGEHYSTTLMALGQRTLSDRVEPRSAPAVSEPGQGAEVELDSTTGGLRRQMEIRSAQVEDDKASRRRLLWFRFPGSKVGDSTSLAIVADFFAPTFTGVLGRPMYGASLDNTIRFFGRAEAEWLLVETSVDGLAEGIGHGTSHIWGDDGQLLATATQTCAVSEFAR